MSQLPPLEQADITDNAAEDFAATGRRHWTTFGTATQLPLAFVYVAALMYPVLFMAAFLARLSSVLGAVLNGTLLVVAIAFAAVTLDLPKPSSVEDENDFSFTIAFLSVVSIVIIVSFGQLCRHLQQLAGGFTATRSSYWYWVGFGLEEFVNAVLLDAPNIYGWRVSDIRAVSLWARSLQFAFHLCLIAVVIVAAWQHARLARKIWRAPSPNSSSEKAWLFVLKVAALGVFWCLTVGIAGVGYVREKLPSVSPVDALAHFVLFTAGAALAIGSAAVWIAGGNLYILIGMLVSPLGGTNRERWTFLWRTLLANGGFLLGLAAANYGGRWIASIIRSPPS